MGGIAQLGIIIHGLGENNLPEASTLYCFAGILLPVFAVQSHTPFGQE